MKKQYSVYFVFFLIINLFPLYLLAGQSVTPADIMEKYGKAIVLIIGIKNGQEVILGSGFIVKSDGVIVTNHHVIEGVYPAAVKTKNGDVFEDISIIDFNEREDIAIIKIKGFDLPTVVLGNSNNVRVGERIIVIGNPHGLENTISDGLLSQIRDSGKGYSLYQISAPISAGSSGSPVFNQRGEVIGIATLSDIFGQNLNFSVPINYTRGMLDGPVKYSLKDFAALAKEPSLATEPKKTEAVEDAEILKKLHSYIVTLLSAWDETVYGLEATGDPHRLKFDAKKYHIDQNIYFANQSLKILQKDLSILDYSDKDFKFMKDALVTATSMSVESSEKIIQALERTNYSNYPFPDWTKAYAGVGEIGNVIGQKIDKEFVTTFVERMRKENPKIESDLTPYFLDIYKNKDKSQEELAVEDRKVGHLNIYFFRSLRICRILYCPKGGPGASAGMKRNDIILGVENGPEFKSVMDYEAFQKTTKPRETYMFRINRKGQTITIKVELE